MTSQQTQAYIVAVSRQQLQAILGVSRPQFARYLADLQALLTQFEQWEYQPLDRAFNEFEITAFLKYREMVCNFGSKFARRNLVKSLENHGYKLTKKSNYTERKRQTRHAQNSRNGQSNQTTEQYISDLLTR